MGLFKGGALRIFQTFLYLLAFLCAAVIIGIYSYFLAVIADHRHDSTPLGFMHSIPDWEKAVEGISGAAVIYTFIAFFLTCCLGGITFFGIIGLILDLCFCGGMIAIAYFTRHGADSCTGSVNTPLGIGNANVDPGFDHGVTYIVHYGLACRLNTACFAVSIIAAVVFLVTALMQIALIKNHKKEKRFGPGPNNNYTSGSGRRWGRKNKNTTRDAEMAGAAGGATGGALAVPAVDTRQSVETGYTGSTVGGPGHIGHDKVEQPAGYTGTHAGYHTQPTGTGVNPYGGYNANTTGTATNY